MKTTYNTPRLGLFPLKQDDVEFISELVNTAEWIQFIGDRNIHSPEDARKYIDKILADPNVKYWVVRTHEMQSPVGVITFIKRDYLEHHDIGFAFLPKYTKQGFAFEATESVLSDLLSDHSHSQILATTVENNSNSIKLLKKLGFVFLKEIQKDGEPLHLYSKSK